MILIEFHMPQRPQRPQSPHQINLAGTLIHKGETYLPDPIRTGLLRWNRPCAPTEDRGENKIKIKMTGRELFYTPTTYYDFGKSSLNFPYNYGRGSV
jgi:hypothetical protein